MSFIKIFHTSSDNIHQVWAAPQKLLGTGEEGKCEYKGVKIRSSVSVSASAFCFVLCGCLRPSVRPSVTECVGCLKRWAAWCQCTLFPHRRRRGEAALLYCDLALTANRPQLNPNSTGLDSSWFQFIFFNQNYIKLSNSVLLLQFRVFFFPKVTEGYEKSVKRVNRTRRRSIDLMPGSL